jgi:hypothetical protein
MVDQTPLTPERWQQIERLFSDIEERPADRAALMAAADPALRETVEKMVAASRQASPLDEASPPIDPDDNGPPPAMLGPYRIETPLGQGGMGRVFRATDTRLHRSVAIKIPADRFSERFEREARAIAALNHPHMCTLHDVGPAYLVMELVEGETLAVRLQRGRLPLEQTVEYGAQIASALAAAHSRGIVHRDLKPANIMLTKSGVKLLDFGLSRSFEDVHATAEWERMGTPAYMAPEQFDGQTTDARTDIYAFGLVLYEMATGGRPSSKPAATLPPALDRLVRRCLEAAPDDRWQSARDLEWELRSALTIPAPAPARPRYRLFGAAFGLLALLLIGVAFVHFSEAPPQPAAVRMSVLLPEKSRFRGLQVSPDGRQIATILVKEGKQQIWIRALDSLEFTPLAGTDGAESTFWSPDSRHIGFFADAKLKKIERSGGPVQTLCDALGGLGGTWNRNGDILFSSDALGSVNILRERRSMHIRRLLTGRGGSSWGPIVVLFLFMASPVFSADDKTVGGHVGFGFPLVTKDGGNVSSLADNFQMGLPIAITVNGPGRMYFDLEFVPIRRGQAKRNSTCCKSRVPVAAGARLCRWKPGGVLGELRPDENGAIRNHAADRQELADRTQLLQGLLCGRRFHISLQQTG